MDNAFATWIQVIASLLSVILALVGLVIARDASREARSNRDFQLDRSVEDEFAIAVSGRRSPAARTGWRCRTSPVSTVTRCDYGVTA